MERTHSIGWQEHRATRPLTLAFIISLSFHFALFVTVEFGGRWGLWRFTPFGAIVRLLKLDDWAERLRTRTAQEANLSRALAQRRAEEREVPLLFVDVDPSQASAEVPPTTRYYSPFNSLAANPDTSKDLGVPQIDGTQDKVLKTKDTLRAAPAARQPQPAPSERQEDQEGAERETPQPLVAQPLRPEPIPESAQAAGETLLAKANPVPRLESSPLTASPAEPLAPARPRYRRVADALAAKQINPYSALVGEKMKLEGGVKRFSIASSLDVRGSPLGSYDAKFIAAVQQCWYKLLEEQRYSLDRMGKVVLDFRLTPDGRIEDLKVAESDVGEIFTTVCELAVSKPQPYDKWPSDVRKIVGTNYRDVRFTFYY